MVSELSKKAGRGLLQRNRSKTRVAPFADSSFVNKWVASKYAKNMNSEFNGITKNKNKSRHTSKGL